MDVKRSVCNEGRNAIYIMTADAFIDDIAETLAVEQPRLSVQSIHGEAD